MSDDRGLSEPALATVLWLDYLTGVLPDTSAIDAATLAVRAGLDDVDPAAVAAELERAGLVTAGSDGLRPTGADFDRSGQVGGARFAYDLTDDTVLALPPRWSPGPEVLASAYGEDETLLARLGLLAVIAAMGHPDSQDGPITIGAMRPWAQDLVETVLGLIVDGLLPDQPHLHEELAEFRAYRQLEEIEFSMPAIFVTGR